jgi:hypothetical protein
MCLTQEELEYDAECMKECERLFVSKHGLYITPFGVIPRLQALREQECICGYHK